MKSPKLTRKERAVMPQLPGYFVSARGQYIRVFQEPMKVKPNKQERIAAREEFDTQVAELKKKGMKYTVIRGKLIVLSYEQKTEASK